VIETIQLITQFGAVAVLVIGLAALLRGDVRTRQELGQVERAANEAIQRLDKRLVMLLEEHKQELAQVRADHMAMLEAITRDRDFFREVAMEALQKADRSAEVAATALQHAESTRR
jgi:hypothetical protein